MNLIGGVRVYAHGHKVPLRGTQQLALLTRLALAPGVEVSREILVDDLWNGQQPRSGTGALRVQVKRLRDGLGDDSSCVVTSPRGYLLDPNVRVDLLELERAIEAATTKADSSPREALALLDPARPPLSSHPLHQLGDYEFAASARQRFVRTQREAALLTSKLLLALDEPDSTLGLLTDLSHLHPFDESVAAVLAGALHSAGNTREALRTITDFRRALGEVGLSPSSALDDIERRMLVPDRSGDHLPGGASTPSTSVKSCEPSTKAALYGRRTERDAIQRILADAQRGRGGCVLIRGEAGIGKTALLTHGADQARAQGLSVWWTKADEIASAQPYDPVVRLRRIHGEIEDAPHASDGLGSSVVDGADGSTTSAFSDSLIAAIQQAAGQQPLVIVLDDAHWVDAETAGLIPVLVLFVLGLRYFKKVEKEIVDLV